MAINDAVHWSADLGGGTRVALVQAGTFRSDAGALLGPVPRLLWDHLVREEIDHEHRLTQALNCLQPLASDRLEPASAPVDPARGRVEFDACGTCAACQRILRGAHPDVMMVEPGDKGSIKIEQVRDIIDRAAYRPFEGRRRVVIIDDADALVDQAQNALLKTLEEPPNASNFLLVTSRPDAMLPTVRSRCPLLRFRPLSPEEVALALTDGQQRVRQRDIGLLRVARFLLLGSKGEAFFKRGIGEVRQRLFHCGFRFGGQAWRRCVRPEQHGGLRFACRDTAFRHLLNKEWKQFARPDLCITILIGFPLKCIDDRRGEDSRRRTADQGAALTRRTTRNHKSVLRNRAFGPVPERLKLLRR